MSDYAWIFIWMLVYAVVVFLLGFSVGGYWGLSAAKKAEDKKLNDFIESRNRKNREIEFKHTFEKNESAILAAVQVSNERLNRLYDSFE